MAESRQIDRSPLPALKSQFDKGLDAAELLRFFLSELRTCIAGITEAINTQDQDALIIIARQLKDAAAGYGFPEITSAANELTEALKPPSIDREILASKANALLEFCRHVAANHPCNSNGHQHCEHTTTT